MVNLASKIAANLSFQSNFKFTGTIQFRLNPWTVLMQFTLHYVYGAVQPKNVGYYGAGYNTESVPNLYYNPGFKSAHT